jgi:predicted aspartyl protease
MSYQVGCRFHCELFKGFIPSIFLLDSGADTTTIIAERFNIDITSLSVTSSALTMAGVTQIHRVRDAIIVFMTDNQIPHPEFLNSVDVVSLPEAPFHGVLGMDILDRFKWRKSRNTWILDK